MPNEICKNAYKMSFYMKLHLKINKKYYLHFDPLKIKKQTI